MKKLFLFLIFSFSAINLKAGYIKNFEGIILDADAPNVLRSTAPFLTTGSIYLTSVTANAPIKILGTNNVPGGSPIIGIDCSSGTCLGPTIDVGSGEITGTLAATNFPALLGDVSNSAGNLVITVIDDSHNHTVATSTFAVTGGTFTVTGGTFSINGIPYRFPNSRGGASTVLQNAGESTGVQTLSWASSGGSGDMILAATQTSSGAKTWTSYSNFLGSATFNSVTLFLSTMTTSTVTVRGYISCPAPNLASGTERFGFGAGISMIDPANGTSNTAIGYNALNLNVTGNANTAVGYTALAANTATGNTAMGQGTLSNNVGGGNNTAVGNAAMFSMTGGDNNTALGSSAMQGANTGSENTALGYGSMLGNTSGSQNTAVGSNSSYNNSTGTNNSALGYYALNDNRASGNTAVGYNSFRFLKFNGGGNSAFGYLSGSTATISVLNQATNLTLIGYNANTNANNLYNAMALGANSIVNSSNTIVFGSTETVSAYMGAGPTAQRISGNIFTMTVSSTVSNTTVETNLISPGQPVVAGTITIPSNFWDVGRSLVIKGAGFYSSTTTTPGTFTLKLKIGSTVVLSTSSVGYVVSQSSQVFAFSTTLTCRATGSGGSVIGQTAFGVYDTTNGFRALPAVNTTPVSVDFSAARDISFTWQDSVASILNTKTLTNFTVDAK